MPLLRSILAIVLYAFLLPVCVARENAPATVEMVQAPAWLERGGVTSPLAPGMTLRTGDVVRTGDGARVYLMLAEGSRVKLGADARIAAYSRSVDPQKFFRSALDVLAGAFRFTTDRLAKARNRDLTIRVSTATIGIRGTDVWGRTDNLGEFIALIEGRIDITRAGATTSLDQAMTSYDAPRNMVATVRPLAPEVLQRLALQTEILPGKGAAGTRGPWRVTALSAADSAVALDAYDRLRDAGFAAKVIPRASADATRWTYEVALTGLPSETEARAAAGRVKTLTGIEAAPVR